MAQFAYRANLSAKSFPLISNNWGQSIIVPGPDNTFNRQVASTEDPDKDVGIPQIYYCHNVVPNTQGFQSVGYTTITDGVPGKTFEYEYMLQDASGVKVYLGVTSAHEFYINDGTGWVFNTAYIYSGLIYVAHVSGTSYIWVPGVGCLVYNFSTKLFSSVTLTGLDPTKIIGICPSFGYLIAWDTVNVAWSSTVDPTDFTPSLITGAGGGAVEGAKGIINFCFPHTLGIFVYCATNTVVGVYSGNARYPFNFREIVNSGGLSNPNLVCYEANSGNHYAYTTSGMQLISSSQGQTVFPEITDFISGLLFEDFDENTLTFTKTTLTKTMVKRIHSISDRYLILSYGITSLTHALVFDIPQKRWGKLKIPHVDCFEYELVTAGVFEIPKQSIAFMQTDGTIKVVDFNFYGSTHAGVILLGKYQYVRSRTLQMDQIDVENVNPANFSLKLFSTTDGKNGTWSVPYDNSPDPSNLNKTYLCRAEGLNHSILGAGTFNFTSLMFRATPGAKR